MTIQPRDIDTAYEDFRDKLTGKIRKLTNFAETSFNYVLTRALARDIQEQEEKILAATLAGWPDYAGRELEREDLEKLGVDYDPDKINEYMKDEHLNQIGVLVGEERFEGQKATGKVTFQTSGDTVRIYEGTVVGTQPDADGNFQSFEVDANSDGEISGDQYVTPSSGATQVTADVIAEDVGPEYNIGSGQLTFLPNPPVGVLGATNQQATSNGENEQGNDSFREDIKKSVSRSSGGGTTAGIRGFIESNVNNVQSGDVIIDEVFDTSPSFVDVIVDGGSDKDVKEAIENSRPTGVRHNLVRPEVQNIGLYILVSGSDIDKDFVRNTVTDYLLGLSMSENFYKDELVSTIMNSDGNILNIEMINAIVPSKIRHSVSYFSTQQEYKFDSPYREGGLSRVVTDKFDYSYIKNQDFEEADLTGDGRPDGIRWIGTSPSDRQEFVEGTAFFVDHYSREKIIYQSGKSSYITQASPTVNTVVVDEKGNEYNSSSYSFQDSNGTGNNDTLVWSDTSALSDGDVFFVKYGEPKSVNEVIDEEHQYTTSSSIYNLDRELILSDKDNVIRDETGSTYQQGTDFEYIDSTGDGKLDSVDWSINASSPADGNKFYVSYKTRTDQKVGKSQKVSPENVRVVVE